MPAQGRSYIESYPDAMKRFEAKLGRDYRFVANPVRELQFTMNHALLLLQQVIRNIKEREAQGIEQKDTWEALQSLLIDCDPDKSHNLKASAVDLYRKLMIEANA